MGSKNRRLGTVSLFATTCLTSLGCAGLPETVYVCALETPGLAMIEEQIGEAERAVDPGLEPRLPHTYAWLVRLDRDCGIFGDPE